MNTVYIFLIGVRKDAVMKVNRAETSKWLDIHKHLKKKYLKNNSMKVKIKDVIYDGLGNTVSQVKPQYHLPIISFLVAPDWKSNRILTRVLTEEPKRLVGTAKDWKALYQYLYGKNPEQIAIKDLIEKLTKRK